MVGVVSPIPPETILFFYFLKPSVSILYRNVRFVLKLKTPIGGNLLTQNAITTPSKGNTV